MSYITSLEDLFDLKGPVIPKLVESNMTNKPKATKPLQRDFHSFTIRFIRLSNLQICHKGKTNAHSHIRG